MVTVGIDCDGVLSNFTLAVCEALREKGYPITPELVTKYQIAQVVSESCGVPVLEVEREIKSIVEAEHFCYRMESHPGAREGIDMIRSIGARVIVVTAPWHTSPHWHHERNEWLRFHCGVEGSDVLHVPSKHKRLIECSVLLEDSADNVNDWMSMPRHGRHGAGILWTRPWNEKEETSATRVTSWPEVIERVTWMR
jgi:hypothetical protein